MGLHCYRKSAVEVIKSHGTNDTAAIHETHYMKKSYIRILKVIYLLLKLLVECYGYHISHLYYIIYKPLCLQKSTYRQH